MFLTSATRIARLVTVRRDGGHPDDETMPKVLIADDDPHIREVLRFALEQASLETVEARDGKQALALFELESPDVVVLDILMPEMDGTDVCRHLRTRSNVPILFLSSMSSELDRIVGLELGGDDYVTKPFSPRELVARVKAMLRRAGTFGNDRDDRRAAGDDEPATLEHGRLRMDLERYRVYWEEREVILSVTEFGILRTLLARPGKVYTRDALMDGAYDLNRVVSDRTIDSHVRRVRGKFKELGVDPIETVHGLGYKLGTC